MPRGNRPRAGPRAAGGWFQTSEARQWGAAVGCSWVQVANIAQKGQLATSKPRFWHVLQTHGCCFRTQTQLACRMKPGINIRQLESLPCQKCLPLGSNLSGKAISGDRQCVDRYVVLGKTGVQFGSLRCSHMANETHKSLSVVKKVLLSAPFREHEDKHGYHGMQKTDIKSPLHRCAADAAHANVESNMCFWYLVSVEPLIYYHPANESTQVPPQYP